uniref:Uncharacterized protein n=1 Tax=viral metagenome TaxID=1070528 RepID=A0A6M3X4G0_9ZZZZ
MLTPEELYLNGGGGFKIHLKPVADKNRIFLTVKRDGRMKRKKYHLKLHLNGGYIEGDFFLDSLVVLPPDQEEVIYKL